MSNTDTAYRDQALQDLVTENLLRDDRVSAQNISVGVDAGVATLTGTVSSYRRKLVAQQIVAANAMIRDVRNELQVEPIQPPPDETIVEHVRAALDTSADVTKETVVVDVVNGKVSLSGNVSSHWERLNAEDIARGIRGVRDVINLLCVDIAHKIDNHELANSVSAALSRARGLKDADINVAIGEDTVVLSGTVEQPWQKEIAQTVVGGFGFLHIRNELHVVGDF